MGTSCVQSDTPEKRKRRNVMTELAKITNEFEGKDITTISYKGRPCWIAAEIGRALSYADNGGRLVTKISQDWSDELIEGSDYLLLEGLELADFKSLVKDPTGSVGSFTARAMLLFESGLHFVCLKTRKPVGRKLRRFLVDEVMPQLVRDGSYSPHREVVDNEVVDKRGSASRYKPPALIREERLAKQMKAKGLRDLAKLVRKSQRFAVEVAENYEIEALEVLCGEDFSDLKPGAVGFWSSSAEIAHDIGATIWEVGRAITQMNIRGNIPGICREITLTRADNSQPVVSHLFSPKAVEMIRKHLGKRWEEKHRRHDLP
jgi:prophage antirepressor-like protein